MVYKATPSKMYWVLFIAMQVADLLQAAVDHNW